MADEQDNLARQACSTCRKQKRKCTRELPICQLCRKNRRPCEYPAETPSVIGSDNQLLIPSRNGPVSLFFLDSYIFSQRHHAAQSTVPVPLEFYEDLDDAAIVNQLVEGYFNSIHTFLPIISKIRLVRLLSSQAPPKLDLAALLLSFKLIRLAPCDVSDGNTMLYDKAKRCILQAEASGILSLRLLQAAILVAVYEISHALYPSAYLSVGHCARLAFALGIHDRKNAPQINPTPSSWTEMEESRRVCWSIHLLDRYVNIGMESRQFAYPDAKPETFLPMDEAQWEAGEQSITPSLAVSSTVTASASPFARACQASHLLSRVLNHVNDRDISPQMFYEEAIRLHIVLESFGKVLGEELSSADVTQFASMCTATGVCYSAMAALYGYHTCAEGDDPAGIGLPEQLKMQEIALSSLKELGLTIASFAGMLTRLSDSLLIIPSPFVVDCLYAAAKNYLWYIRESGKIELREIVQVPLTALRVLGQRWAVGNEYLSILEGEDFMPT